MTNSDPDELRATLRSRAVRTSSDRAALRRAREREREREGRRGAVDAREDVDEGGGDFRGGEGAARGAEAGGGAGGIGAVIGENRKARWSCTRREKAEPGKGHGQRALDWR